MPTPARRAPLGTISAGSPMQITATDILGPFPETAEKNRYILVAGDYFTHWMEAYAIPNQEAATVAKALVDQFFCRFSPPEQLHSDQGKQFESELIAEVCKMLHITKTRTTAYHPQCDGLVERYNRTLLSMLATCAEEHPFEWEDYIPKICLAYNTSIHPATGYAPFYLMFGRQARIPADLMFGRETTASSSSPADYASKLQDTLECAYDKARQNIGEKQRRQKEFYDQRIHGAPVQEGDVVWLHTPATPRGTSRKLHCPWSGPFKVIKKLSDVNYYVQHTLHPRKKMVVHFDRLKPCRQPEVRQRNSTPTVPNLETTLNSRAHYEVELLDHDSDETEGNEDQSQQMQERAPEPRYPRRNRRPPDRLHPYITH